MGVGGRAKFVLSKLGRNAFVVLTNISPLFPYKDSEQVSSVTRRSRLKRPSPEPEDVINFLGLKLKINNIEPLEDIVPDYTLDKKQQPLEQKRLQQPLQQKQPALILKPLTANGVNMPLNGISTNVSIFEKASLSSNKVKKIGKDSGGLLLYKNMHSFFPLLY